MYACSGGPCAGGLFWQLMAQGMDGFRDGYEVVFEESPSTTRIIDHHPTKAFPINHKRKDVIGSPYLRFFIVKNSSIRLTLTNTEIVVDSKLPLINIIHL